MALITTFYVLAVGQKLENSCGFLATSLHDTWLHAYPQNTIPHFAKITSSSDSRSRSITRELLVGLIIAQIVCLQCGITINY